MAHTFDANLPFTGNSSPLTSAYTCGSGATLLVLGIVVKGGSWRAGGSPTYNGVALTHIVTCRYSSSPETSVELWYMASPPTGTAHAVSVPNQVSNTIHCQVSSYKAGSGYTSGLYYGTSAVGLGSNPAYNVVGRTNGVVVSVLGSGRAVGPIADTGITLNSTNDGTYSDHNQYAFTTTDDSISVGWTTGETVDDFAIVSGSFQEAEGSVTVTPTALAMTSALPSVTVATGADITVMPAALAITSSLGDSTVIGDVTVTPTALAITSALKATIYPTNATYAATALTLTSAMPYPTYVITLPPDISFTVPVLTMTSTLHAPNIDSLKFVRMVGFIYSADIAYMIEFGDKYARFYYGGEPLLYLGNHVEIETPYAWTDLLRIQFKQIADTMWCIHPDYAPRKLTRTSATSFSLDEIAFEKGPFLTRHDLDEQYDDDGVTMVSTVIGKDQTGTMTASADTFLAGHLGSIWQLVHPATALQTSGVKTGTDTELIGEAITILGDYTFSITNTGWSGTVQLQKSDDSWVTWTVVKSATVKTTYAGTELEHDWQYRMWVTAHTTGNINASLVSSSNSLSGKMLTTNTGLIGGVPIKIKGGFTFKTHGTWTGTVVLERNENDAGWEPYRTYTSDNDTNAALTGIEEEEDVWFRINVTAHASGTITADLTADDSTKTGIVRIDTVASATSAGITVLAELASATETKRWAEGAWSDVQGYPAAICFFESRCIYVGTSENLPTIWFSHSDHYEDFAEGVKDADSFSLLLPTTNEVRWIEALQALCVGTSGDEWIVRSSKSETPLTPTSFSVRQQSTYGSAPIQAVRMNDAVLFVDVVGRKVRELTYRFESDKYVAPDMTELADNITESGITWIARQRNPDTILWCGLADGSLISMTYEREQNVVAWSEYPVGGEAQSGAVIPGDGEDEVWLSVRRDIDNVYKTYIEQFAPRTFGTDLADAYFVDCGVTHESSTATTSITGLDHLEGETVAVLGDGVVLAEQTVSGGAITLPVAVKKAQVGLSYTWLVEPMRIDVNSQAGTSHGSLTRINEIDGSFMDSAGMKQGTSDADLTTVVWDRVEWPNLSEIDGLFTGDVVFSFDGGFGREQPVVVSGSDPLPVTLRAIVARLEQTGR